MAAARCARMPSVVLDVTFTGWQPVPRVATAIGRARASKCVAFSQVRMKLLRREDMENKEVERQRIARHRTPWDSW